MGNYDCSYCGAKLGGVHKADCFATAPTAGAIERDSAMRCVACGAEQFATHAPFCPVNQRPENCNNHPATCDCLYHENMRAAEESHHQPGSTFRSALDHQEGGNHYKDMAIQPIEYCHRNALGACESAVVKYVTRWRKKNGIEDLKKARHYIDLLIEMETK